MREFKVYPKSSQDESIAALVKGILGDLAHLVSNHWQLTQSGASLMGKHVLKMTKGLILGSSFFIVSVAMGFAGLALAINAYTPAPLWLAFLASAGVALLLGLVFWSRWQTSLKKIEFLPKMAKEELKEELAWIKKTMS